MMLSADDKRDVARRLYDELITPDENVASHHCKECYLDGLWMGLTRSGMKPAEFESLEGELMDLVDGLIEGSWE